MIKCISLQIYIFLKEVVTLFIFMIPDFFYNLWLYSPHTYGKAVSIWWIFGTEGSKQYIDWCAFYS